MRFGGAVMLQGEPAALTRIAPGASVDLGTTRFETIEGGYPEAMYAYRKMLDEKGCRFPKDFNPPVHWEQLYDMPNAWEDRPHRYTKEIVEREAAKGRDYSCEALYLDPGWDTDFATFLWGEKWLGPRKQFIDEMRSKYGLKVSLHTPLATWMSHTGLSWGIGAVQSYPQEARRTPPAAECRGPDAVPAVRDGRRNLALLPAAKANASSLFADGKWPIHQTAHLNDGWYGNDASWIADKMPAWAEIDLGAEYEIGEVRLGNDHLGRFTDRGITELQDSGGHEVQRRFPIAPTGTRSPNTAARPCRGRRSSVSRRRPPAGCGWIFRRPRRTMRRVWMRSKSTRPSRFRRARRRHSPRTSNGGPRIVAWSASARSNTWPPPRSGCWPTAPTASSS